MKIVYHYRTSAQDGGAVHIESLVRALRELGAEVVLVAPPTAVAAVGAKPRHAWLTAMRKRLPPVVHEVAELAYNFPEAWRLWRAVRRHRPDLIYERANLFLLSGCFVARQTGTLLISEVNAPYAAERAKHGGLAFRRIAAWLEGRSWQCSAAVIAVTGVLADIIVAGGVPRGRVHVVPNGIDPGVFTERNLDPQAKARLGLREYTVLGFTGFVRDWNGLETVIDLLAGSGGEHLFLLVVGDGPARTALETHAFRQGVADRVRFTGVVSREEIVGYVSAFDIALQPAANPYASPLKLFEYMALARPIVAPDQDNIREVLQDGADSLLFPPGDRTAFAGKVKRLVLDAALRQRLAAGAAEVVRTRDLTWRRNAERLLNLVMTLRDSARAEAQDGAMSGDAGA